MELQAVFQSTLGASLGTVLVQVFAPWWRERGNRRSQAAYLALRLAVAFEEFGAACHERNVENDHAETPPDQEYPDWNPWPPDLPPIPEDHVGWLALNALDANLANRALTFRSKTASASAAIAFCLRFYDDHLAEIMDVQISECGIEAASLARDLRAKFGLGQPEAEWDWLGSLETTRDKARAREQKRRQKQVGTEL